MGRSRRCVSASWRRPPHRSASARRRAPAHRPGRRRSRCVRATRPGCPTAATMRLTWWYLPSVSVSRSVPGPVASQAAARTVSFSSCSSTPCAQPLDLRRIDRMLAAHLVDLGHVMLRRGQAMDQRAVVGEQQHAGRVLVEPADRLHAALAQGRGQQRIDARMVLWLLRAFVSRRLVHDQERALDGTSTARRGRRNSGRAARPRGRARCRPRPRSPPTRRRSGRRIRGACRSPGVNSSCASFTAGPSGGQLEQGDVVARRRPGAADDPLLVELADDRSRRSRRRSAAASRTGPPRPAGCRPAGSCRRGRCGRAARRSSRAAGSSRRPRRRCGRPRRGARAGGSRSATSAGRASGRRA